MKNYLKNNILNKFSKHVEFLKETFMPRAKNNSCENKVRVQSFSDVFLVRFRRFSFLISRTTWKCSEKLVSGVQHGWSRFVVTLCYILKPLSFACNIFGISCFTHWQTTVQGGIALTSPPCHKTTDQRSNKKSPVCLSNKLRNGGIVKK